MNLEVFYTIVGDQLKMLQLCAVTQRYYYLGLNSLKPAQVDPQVYTAMLHSSTRFVWKVLGIFLSMHSSPLLKG